MNTFIDSQNFVSSLEEAPDKLRGELGTYYGPYFNQVGALQRNSGKIEPNFEITEVQQNNQVLIPIKNQRIYFYGNSGSFENQEEWNQYAQSIVVQQTAFTDHLYNIQEINVTNNFRNNYFFPEYEDLTKETNSNLLINYNLVNYKHNKTAKFVKDIAGFRTRFDNENYEIKNNDAVKKLFRQYTNRLEQYTGSVAEISERQRNIFMLSDDVNGISTAPYFAQFADPTPPPFPFQYEKNIDMMGATPISFLNNLTRETKVDKFIHQCIKSNVYLRNLSFRAPDGENVSVISHDLIDMVITKDFINFNLNFDELFLLEEDELGYNSPEDRFVNRVRAIDFLSQFSARLKTPSVLRDIEKIYDSRACQVNYLGYKIEKYVNNDLTSPTQTYYVNSLDHSHIDTQLRYGRKYIYKTFALVAVYGSSYEYSNLHISTEEGSMKNPVTDEVTTQSEANALKTYKAFVDVETRPSIRVLEIPLDTHEVMFYDQPTMPPQVNFYNQDGRSSVEMFFRPNLNSSYDTGYLFKTLVDSDDVVSEKLSLSSDNIYGTVFKSDYFTGRYEIYRLDRPPLDISEFADNFLTEVDVTSTVMRYSENVSGIKTIQKTTQSNQNAYFEDSLVPNRRYYYLFRTLTYHGTPSNYTPIYEVELLQDADETKINFSEYKIPKDKSFMYRKKSKRIMKISPNFDHLIFTGEETNVNDALQNIGILDTKLVSNSQTGETFKIRITSKHTGKKMDINLTVKLKDEVNT